MTCLFVEQIAYINEFQKAFLKYFEVILEGFPVIVKNEQPNMYSVHRMKNFMVMVILSKLKRFLCLQRLHRLHVYNVLACNFFVCDTAHLTSPFQVLILFIQ